MEIEFRLPSLGADMERATLTTWLKKPGEAVHRGEAIAVVETEKGLIDIECFDEGIVSALIVEPGTKIAVGTVLARLTAAGTGVPPTSVPRAAAPATAAAAAAPAVRVPPPPAAPAAAGPAGEAAARLRISPAARRRAQELGLTDAALGRLAAGGMGGIVHIEDIERLAAGGAAAAPAADARDAMRVVIGNAMARAKREIPHYYLGHTIDFAAARSFLQRHNAGVPVAERLLEGILIAKAVALAAARIAGFNGYFRDGRFERAPEVNLGMAIAVRGGGLVAPALLAADRKDLRTLMHEFSELVSRVRSGHMRSGEFTAATITVTSLGEDGVEAIYPIINPPQVAIVGSGCVVERPGVCEGSVAVRPQLTLTLAADHRVTDGRAGARFVCTIAELLAAPEKLR